METFCSERDPVEKTKTLGENIYLQTTYPTKDWRLEYIKELSQLKSEKNSPIRKWARGVNRIFSAMKRIYGWQIST